LSSDEEEEEEEEVQDEFGDFDVCDDFDIF